LKQTIISDENGIRIDSYLAKVLDNFSRAYIAGLISDNLILCNGSVCKPSHKITIGDEIVTDIPDPKEISAIPQEIPIEIVYEDEYLAVINKPQGMVVHPAAGHRDNTLVNALMFHYKGELSDLNGVIRPGIVHRIDKDTSGLLLIVKKNEVHSQIAAAIQKHEIKRTYRTLVNGIISENEGTIDLPVGRSPSNRLKNAVVKSGKNAITHFKVIERFYGSNITYVEVTLETGRTHQIRVHFAYIKHPVLGDTLYGGARKDFRLDGQTLHAYKLEFLHPVNKNDIMVEAPIPEYFEKLLKLMRP
jgi:23S rRNA pseudouridine1911/1915/1917 synthase